MISITLKLLCVCRKHDNHYDIRFIVWLSGGRQGEMTAIAFPLLFRGSGASRVRKRTLRFQIEVIDNFLCGFLTGAHTIGNSDAVIGAAGESECGESIQRGFNSFYSSV